MDKEIWKDMKNFKGFYKISNEGQIKNKKNKILKTSINHNGYIVVYLYKDGKKYAKKVHRLVAETFITKIEGKNQVNHIDGNKRNNNVNNLEWCTQSENIKHAYKNNLYEKQRSIAKKNIVRTFNSQTC